MGAKIPVYIDLGGTPQIVIYEETEDGHFRKTTQQPLRELKSNIEGIGPSEGELLSKRYDRSEREWDSPTVKYNLGRPKSFYRFIRDQAKQRKMIVVSTPTMSPVVTKFQVHTLQIKRHASTSVIAIMLRRYLAALDIWDGPKQAEQSASG